MTTTNGVIYKITCEPSGLSYIGRTIQSLSVRISQHKGKDSYCRLLSDAVHEYGWDDNFSVRVLWESHDYVKWKNSSSKNTTHSLPMDTI